MTPRMKQVYALMMKGESNAAIGAELGISYETVKQYVSRIHKEFGVGTKLKLMALRIAELEARIGG